MPRGATDGAPGGSATSPADADSLEDAYPNHTGHPPGLLLWRVVHPAPEASEDGEAGHASGPPLAASRGYPVVVVRSTRDPAELLVFDGVRTYPVPVAELQAPLSWGVEDVARPFTHVAAGPSGRYTSPEVPSPRPPSPLGWLSPEGLAQASEVTFTVPRSALRHIIGRGGATIRRMEAFLGVLVGAADGPGDSAAVSVCGPPARLAFAGRVVRLVGQGHRSLLGRLEEGPGAWRVSDAGEAGGS